MAPLHVVRHLSAVLVFAAAAMSQTNSSADSSSGSTRGGMCNSSISNANASGIFTFPVQYPLQNPDRSRAMEQVQETSHVLHGPSPSLVETVRKSTETSGTTLQGKTIATIWPSTTTCALLRLGQHDLGNCSSMFTERCINNLTYVASRSAHKWISYSSSPPYENLTAGVLPSICNYIYQNLQEGMGTMCGPELAINESDSFQGAVTNVELAGK